MFPIWDDVALLFCGLLLTILSAHQTINVAASLSDRLGVSGFAVGAVFLTMVTSLPEVVVALMFAFRNMNDAAIANVTGSNICNICLGIGIAVCISKNKKLHLHYINHRDNVYSFVVAILVLFFVFVGGVSNLISRILFGLSLVLIGFLYYVQIARSSSVDVKINKIVSDNIARINLLFKRIPVLIILIIFLLWGVNIFIDRSISLASRANIFDEVAIGAFASAFGTSLPEIILSITAFVQGRPDIATGNILGSNICNIAFGLGACCLSKEMAVSKNVIPAAICCSLTMMYFFIRKALFSNESFIYRREGFLMVVFYVLAIKNKFFFNFFGKLGI